MTFSSKLALLVLWWRICLAAAVTKHTGNCEALATAEVSEQRALLQHSGKPSILESGVFEDEAEIDAEMHELEAQLEALKSMKADSDAASELPDPTQATADTGSELADDIASYAGSISDLEPSEEAAPSIELSAKKADATAEKTESGSEVNTEKTDATAEKTTAGSESNAEKAETTAEKTNATTEKNDATAEKADATAEKADQSCNWQCYVDRYPDLQDTLGKNDVEAAERHWNTLGKNERRNCKCGGTVDDDFELTKQTPLTDLFAEAVDADSEIDVDKKDASAESASQKSDAGSEAAVSTQGCDWQCYLDNYPDLQAKLGTTDVAKAEKHWISDGQKEGRNCKCAAAKADGASELTAEKVDAAPEACNFQCYLDRYPDLKESLDDTIAAEQHWNDIGKSEGRNCKCGGKPDAVPEPTAEKVVDAGSALSVEKVDTVQPIAAPAPTAVPEPIAEKVLDAVQAPTTVPEPIAEKVLDAVPAPAAVPEPIAEKVLDAVPGPATVPEPTAEKVLDVASAPTAGTVDAVPVAFDATNAQDLAKQCQPIAKEAQDALEAEIKDYEASEKFQEKILEAKGEKEVTAGHVSIRKFLKENVLEPGWSVLELGCAAGGMLRFVEDEYKNGIGEHDSLVGVELVNGWVTFAQEYYKSVNSPITIYKGDITEYSLPEPYAQKTFDFVMINDVIEHVEKSRYGCFFSQLDKVTHDGSIVYMHTPSPVAQLADQTQFYENVVPHHFVVTGMGLIGFELLSFEYDLDTECGGEGESLPRQLKGAKCYFNGWPKYTHNVYRKVSDRAVLNIS